MNPQLAVASVLSVIVLIWLVVEAWRPASDSKASKLLRLVCLIASAAAFHTLLFPPRTPVPERTLVVLTEGAVAAGIEPTPNERMLALPEAESRPDTAAVDRAADLASALRRFPETTQLRILGLGLGPRDLGAASSLSVDYEAPAGLAGIVGLQGPPIATPGALWSVRGRIAGDVVTPIELLDPAANVVGSAEPDADGHFELYAHSPVAGTHRYMLRRLAADAETLVEQVSLPVQIEQPQPQRIQLWSRAPNAEFKYLRRWATDSGQQLSSAINLRPRLSMRLGNPQLSADVLAKTDLLLLDDRSWLRLSDSQRSTILEAVDAGLGLLLRLTGEPNSRARTRLAALGFDVVEAEISRQTRLAALEVSDDPLHSARRLQLSRRPVVVSAANSLPLLSDAQGVALGRWKPQGQGRVGLLWVADTYGLLLNGERVRYASAWSHMLGTLARATEEPSARLIGDHHWVDERLSWCELAGDWLIIDPNGHESDLVVDVASACASYWPTVAGWHQLRSADHVQRFFVRSVDDGRALREQALIASNLSLASDLPKSNDIEPLQSGPRWPWLLLWLAVSGGLWWLERRVTRSDQAG